MINKKIIIGITVFFLVTIYGFIQINIINTKSLSPTGNSEDNYELVKEEFGSDFEEFIKDDAEIKIYTPKADMMDTTVKINDKEFIIKLNNKFTQKIYNLGEYIYNGFNSIIDNVTGKTISNEEEIIQELDNIVNDFLEKNKKE